MTNGDAALVRRCIDGDDDAVRAFAKKFQGRIFGVCYRMLRHREDAEDVSQDVFLRIFRNLHRWDGVRPLLPWLMTITVNRCRTAMQQRTRVPTPTEIVEHEAGGEPPPDAELAEELQLALSQLREEYRTCFVLFHQQEMRCVEIGEVLNCPEGTVKTWLHRARKELADFLRRRGVVNVPSELQRV